MLSKRKSVASTNSSSGSLMQSKNSDVVKRGCLYVKRPPSSNPVKLRFRTWQKRHLVLRDMPTQDGDPLLQLYSSEATANESVDGDPAAPSSDHRRCSINLRNVFYVDAYHDSKSFPHAFIVLRTGKSPVIFGANTDLEMREWMVAIKLMSDKVVSLLPSTSKDGTLTPGRQTDRRHPPAGCAENRSTLRKDDLVHRSTPLLLENGCSRTNAKVPHHSPSASSRERLNGQLSSDSLSMYLVKIQATDDATQNQLFGEYQMVVNESDISLKRSSSSRDSEVSITWPLKHIRKLKSETRSDGQGDLITLVASSRCGQFQGTYAFRITSGLELIRRVRMFAKKLESNDSSCRRQQREIERLKSAASSSLDKLLPSLQDGGSGGGSACQSLQSLVESSGSSSGSHLDQHEDSCASSLSGPSHPFTGNSYLPIVEDGRNSVASVNQPISNGRSMTLSRSMGSIAILSANARHTDSGFEDSSDEVISFTINPPIPPPRPVHTIGLR